MDVDEPRAGLTRRFLPSWLIQSRDAGPTATPYEALIESTNSGGG